MPRKALGPEDLPNPHIRVVHAPPSGKDIGDALGGPEIGLEPVAERSLRQEFRKGLDLFGPEARGSTGTGLGFQRGDPSFGESGLPVVDGLRRDTEAVSYLGRAHTATEQTKAS